jgi:hypothetical protein
VIDFAGKYSSDCILVKTLKDLDDIKSHNDKRVISTVGVFESEGDPAAKIYIAATNEMQLTRSAVSYNPEIAAKVEPRSYLLSCLSHISIASSMLLSLPLS